MPTRCFLIEPTDRTYRALRRYSGPQAGRGWTCETGYHNALVRIADGTLVIDDHGFYRTEPEGWPRDDPRWPTHCTCGYAFGPDDPWQLFYERLYRDPRTGAEYTIRDAPPGAMWRAEWMEDVAAYRGPDGQCLAVVLPDGHQWMIDGRASNCTRPKDNDHKCWVRHGEPPNLTVDKNGNTCQAGAGSIVSAGYHGFLVDGYLTDDLGGRSYG